MFHRPLGCELYQNYLNLMQKVKFVKVETVLVIREQQKNDIMPFSTKYFVGPLTSAYC